MHVRIRAEPLGRLSLIREIPDARLAMLEGLNGVGKTLAIRLLEICTGTMPYRGSPRAWESLRSGLGPFRVDITHLSVGADISCTGNSLDWPESDETEPNSDWFREITIGGQEATLDEVRALLIVRRMAGDEGILNTFAQIAEEDARRVRSWAQRFASPEGSPLADLEDRVARAEELLGGRIAERYVELQTALGDAEDYVDEAEGNLTRAQGREAELQEAQDIYENLTRIQEQTPEIAQQLAELDTKIGCAEEEHAAVQSELRNLIAKSVRAEPARKELRHARRTLNRNLGRLSSTMVQAARMATSLDVEPRLTKARELIEVLEAQIDRIRTEQTTLDAAPVMRSLLDRVTSELDDVESLGLGEEIVLDDTGTGLQMSVVRARTGMLVRRQHLEDQPPPPEALQLEEQVADVEDKLLAASALVAKLREVARYERLVEENEIRLDKAMSADVEVVSQEIQDLEERRRAIDEERLSLATERAQLAENLGGAADPSTVAAIEQQLTQALGTLDLTETLLPEALSEAQARTTEASGTLQVARENWARALDEFARASADVQRAANTLAEDDRVSWLRSALTLNALPSDGTADQLLSDVQVAHSTLLEMNDRLGRHREQLGAIAQALETVAGVLRGQQAEAQLYVRELQRWLGGRLGGWLSNTRVRQELLPNAVGGIAVDVATREVTWHESAVTYSRPLEAFSSGEQAFTYTRARLALLDEEAPRAANRLIVLDEFGAFIAHDRLEGLVAYLRDRADEYERDQVLVILPLSRDYGDLAQNASSTSAADKFEALAEQVQTRGYAVQDLAR